MHLGDDSLVLRTLEFVEPWPVLGQVAGLEDLDVHALAVGVEGQPGEPEGTPPALLDEPAVHVAGEPATDKITQLVMVRLSRRKTSVGRQAASRTEIITHRTRLTPPLPQAPDEAGTLAGVSERAAQHLKDALGIKTIGELGRSPYFRAARAIAGLADAK